MKTHTQEKHDNLAEYFERMQKPLGHHSWWYTNRNSDDCVNVKMHCYVDTDDVLELLTEKERKAVDVLDIDVEQWIEDEKWQIIEMSRAFLLHDINEENKHELFSVYELDYGGRSGGWLCVVFELYGLNDYIEGYDYASELYKDKQITKKEWQEWCKIADEAVAYIEQVHESVKKMHKDLCTYIEDPLTYVDGLKGYISDCIDCEAENIKASTEKLQELAQ